MPSAAVVIEPPKWTEDAWIVPLFIVGEITAFMQGDSGTPRFYPQRVILDSNA
jgi:hypothetical protein